MKFDFKYTSILIFLIFLENISFASQNKSLYFKEIDYNNKYQIIGKNPVDYNNNSDFYHFLYNENGKIKLIEFISQGKRNTDKVMRVCKIIFFYSLSYEKRIFLNEYDELNQCKEGYDCIKLKISHNSYEEMYVYTNGKLTKDIYGISSYKWNLDQQGQIIKTTRYNSVGSIISDNEGFMITKKKYDERNNEIEFSNYNINDELINDNYEIAKRTYKYDERNNIIEINYYDKDDQLIHNDNNYYKYEYVANYIYKYDLKNNRIENQYRNNKGELVQTKSKSYDIIKYDNVSIEKYEYNENRDLISHKTFNKDLNLQNDESGIAMIIYKYDNKNNWVETSYYDDKNQLKLNKEGIAIIKNKYDENNNCTESVYLGTNEQFIYNNLSNKANYNTPITRFKYDNNRNLCEISTYGIDEELAINNFGFAIQKIKYLNNKIINISYYGIDKKPINSSKNFSSLNNVYNEKSKLVEVSYYNSGNKLIRTEKYDYANKVISKYLANGLLSGKESIFTYEDYEK